MPYTSITVRDVALLCFPPTDAVFANLVRELVSTAERLDPDDLERQLRRHYPGAVVRARHQLASLRGPAWYAYRDGRYSPFVDEPWWDRPEVARLVIGDDGRYLDANEVALGLLGTSLATLTTLTSGDFTKPEYRELVPWIQQLLVDSGELHSTSVVCPRDGRAEIPVEYHFVYDGDGRGRHVAWLRPVAPEAVIDARASGATARPAASPGTS